MTGTGPTWEPPVSAITTDTLREYIHSPVPLDTAGMPIGSHDGAREPDTGDPRGEATWIEHPQTVDGRIALSDQIHCRVGTTGTTKRDQAHRDDDAGGQSSETDRA